MRCFKGFFKNLLNKNNASGIIILNNSDIKYFSGITSSNIALLITEDDSYVFSDSRYKYRIESQNNFIPEVCENSVLCSVYQKINLLGLKKVIIDPSDISHKNYMDFFGSVHSEIVFSSDISRDIRAIKTEDEIKSIADAQRIAEMSLMEILPGISENMTTKEISDRLDFAMSLRGSEEPSFSTIVLSGEQTADCHGIPDKTPVKYGDLILFDFGATVNGYRSDMTRTIAFGEPGSVKENIYNIVLEAHNKAAEAIKAGAAAKDIDAAARKIIDREGYKEKFLHSTGHGVGIDIHEFPNISPKSEAILQKNMIITVEPGIYIKNMFGVRIEDMYIVDEKSGVSMAEMEKKLIKLK